VSKRRLTLSSPYLYACPVPLVVFLLLTLAIFCSAQDRRAPGKNPFQNNPQAAETGRAMFRIYRAPCHGIQARGGRGPDLTRGTYFAGESDPDLSSPYGLSSAAGSNLVAISRQLLPIPISI
jgi:hypothetical protein